MLELLFFAFIAAVVIYKLFSILGENYDDEERISRSKSNFQQNLFTSPNNQNIQNIKPINAELISATELSLNPELQSAIKTIRQLDKSFELDVFIEGAKKAFYMIIDALTNGDKETLKQLLSENVYNKFCLEIDNRNQSGNIVSRKVIEIISIDLVDTNINGKLVQLSLAIASKQNYILKDKFGSILNGSPDAVTEHSDKWTFIKHFASGNIWKLNKTT